MVTYSKKIFLSLAVSSLFYSPALMADEAMIKSIMELRSDVEALYSQIDTNKETYKASMKSYGLQMSDDEARINREKTTLKLNQQNIAEMEKKLASMGNATIDLAPMIEEALKGLEKEIISGIPFKTDERLAAIKQIREDLKNKTITQEKALALTWASYDDMLRLTKEIGQFKQEIELDGKQTMAKIAKVGSVMMFFATPDDRVGYVKQEGATYRYNVVSGDEREQIIALFDALQKQIRTGYFTLPNALLLGGAH